MWVAQAFSLSSPCSGCSFQPECCGVPYAVCASRVSEQASRIYSLEPFLNFVAFLLRLLWLTLLTCSLSGESFEDRVWWGSSLRTPWTHHRVCIEHIGTLILFGSVYIALALQNPCCNCCGMVWQTVWFGAFKPFVIWNFVKLWKHLCCWIVLVCIEINLWG